MFTMKLELWFSRTLLGILLLSSMQVVVGQDREEGKKERVLRRRRKKACRFGNPRTPSWCYDYTCRSLNCKVLPPSTNRIPSFVDFPEEKLFDDKCYPNETAILVQLAFSFSIFLLYLHRFCSQSAKRKARLIVLVNLTALMILSSWYVRGIIASSMEKHESEQVIVNHFEFNKEQHLDHCSESSKSLKGKFGELSERWPNYIKPTGTRHGKNAFDERRLRFLALYFPQWYPAPENQMTDDWRYFYNKSFSHNYLGQPIFRPQNNLYYDSRCKGIRTSQAALAERYLVDGFVYYFYWFESRMFLPEVMERMLEDGQPDIDFCLMWVNEAFGNYRIEYDFEEIDLMVEVLIRFFRHPRYIHLNGRPVLYVYLGSVIPQEYMELLGTKLIEQGSQQPYIVTSIQLHYTWENHKIAFADAYAEFPPNIGTLWQSYGYTDYNFTKNYHLGLAVNFDNTPRLSDGNPDQLPRLLSKNRELPTSAANPTEFRDRCISRVKSWYHHNMGREKFVLIFAWNEWSEQAALEPSDVHGYGFLEALKSCKEAVSSKSWHEDEDNDDDSSDDDDDKADNSNDEEEESDN
jgi:hypothetical protein